MKQKLFLLLVLILLGAGGTVSAQDTAASYPNKSVRILVGYQAGGPTDLTARLIASKLQAILGQPFIVENKPGASSNRASEIVAASAPDGYTLLVAASQLISSSVLFKDVKFDAEKSFAPITEIMMSPAVLVVGPSLQVASLPELIELAKKSPGKLSYASTGSASVPHVSAELFQLGANIKLLHVPYRGAGLALNDLLGGQVDIFFMTALSAIPYIQSGKVRPLAVTSKQRLPQLPTVPTMMHAGILDLQLESWNGLFAPAGTPQPLIDKLYREVSKVLKDPEVRKTFEDQAAVVVGNSPKEFAAYIRQEVQRVTTLSQTVKIEID